MKVMNINESMELVDSDGRVYFALERAAVDMHLSLSSVRRRIRERNIPTMRVLGRVYVLATLLKGPMP